MKKNKVDKRRIVILAGSIFGVLLLVIGFTYAWFTLTLTGSKTNIIKVGNLQLTIANETNQINLTDAYPMSDTDGQALTPYTFTLENTGNIAASYVLKLIDDTASKNACTGCKFLPIDAIKYEFKVNSATKTGILPTTRILDSGTIQPGSANKKTYSLTLWLDSSRDLNSTYQNANFFGKIEITGQQ